MYERLETEKSEKKHECIREVKIDRGQWFKGGGCDYEYD